ncbi:MAG: hypothetical protein H0Z37_09900 [Firmicutes bacterium]|nr:hypothetical protein [Bacillota bacterium]
MGLDVTVIVAQIINFAVLVWLLNRFLYRPVKGMIKAREDQVRRRIQEAEAMQAEAQQALAAYREQQAELERERGRLLEQAREEARQERARLLEAAAREAEEARRRFAETLAAERAELVAAIQEKLVRQVCATSGRVLSQLSGMSLGDAIIDTLETRWEEQGGTPLLERGQAAAGKLVVRTSFRPAPEQKSRLAALAARMAFGAPVSRPAQGHAGKPAVEFQIDPALGLGVEIESGGTFISWTARDILEELEKDAVAKLAPRAAWPDAAPSMSEAHPDA